MSDLPIRKEGDELAVRDAAGVLFKAVVEKVDSQGNFHIRMPAGHTVGSQPETTSYSWYFYRDETADFGLTILGPWREDSAPSAEQRHQAFDAVIHLAARGNPLNARTPSDITEAAEVFAAFLAGDPA